MPDRYVDYVPIDQVALAPRNPKGHNGDGIRTSIGHFGFAELPLLDERTGRLVAGHGRHEQLTALYTAGHTPPDGIRVDGDGTWCMPVIRGWASRSDADAEAYLIGSNQWTIAGGWNDSDLAGVLVDLATSDLLELTGFTDADLAALLDEPVSDEDPSTPGHSDLDAAPEPPATPVTQTGDVWLLGPHRITCGDCRNREDVARVLDGALVNVAFTSPPYASQRKYDETSGFQPIRPEDYVSWFEDVQANIQACLADDGSWFVNMKEHAESGQRHLYVKELTIAHVRRWGWRFIDELAWITNGLPGRFDERFKNQWESIFHFGPTSKIKFRPDAVSYHSARVTKYRREQGFSMKSDSGYNQAAPHVEEEGMALPGNVLEIATEGRGSGVGRGHTAAFPVKLPAWFIGGYSDPGDTVFDPFMGSGTTLIAAHQEQRVAYGMDISPSYCDVTCKRWQTLTGELPVLASTGEPHDFTRGDDA